MGNLKKILIVKKEMLSSVECENGTDKNGDMVEAIGWI